jgi:ABC-2 type transport system permease protein
MVALLAFVKIAFKREFAYRSTILFGSLGSLLSVIVQTALWRFIFRQDPAMIQYMTAYVVISQLLQHTYWSEIPGIMEERVRTGDFAIDLIKPVTSLLTYWSISLGRTCAHLAVRSLPSLVVFAPVLLSVELDIVGVLTFFTTVIIGYILTSMVFTLVGYLAFVVNKIAPFHRTTIGTITFLSGALVPIAFFPPWLASITRLLPFHLLYSFPIRILLKDLSREEMLGNLVLLGCWTVLVLAVLVFVHRRALWRSVVQGG